MKILNERVRQRAAERARLTKEQETLLVKDNGQDGGAISSPPQATPAEGSRDDSALPSSAGTGA